MSVFNIETTYYKKAQLELKNEATVNVTVDNDGEFGLELFGPLGDNAGTTVSIDELKQLKALIDNVLNEVE
jgi:hypothetical protein